MFINFIQNVAFGISESFQVIGSSFGVFAVRLLLALIILFIGWLVASLVGRLINDLVKLVKLDKILDQIGVSGVVKKSGYKLNSGAFLGGIAKWFLIVVVLIPVFDLLGVGQISNIVVSFVVGIVPTLLMAAFVLLAGSILANFADNVIRGSLKAAEGGQYASMLGTIAKWIVWIVAVVIAVGQLGIQFPENFVYIVLIGVVAMLAIAGGVAFGVGGSDQAKIWLKEWSDSMKKKK
ncbi:MAG: hypothetical protein OEX08_02085 [Candidatus Nomurabacteria bacterium]|nr:hypothetical protein [Candidatus Nomurabacteria bacterium]